MPEVRASASQQPPEIIPVINDPAPQDVEMNVVSPDVVSSSQPAPDVVRTVDDVPMKPDVLSAGLPYSQMNS